MKKLNRNTIPHQPDRPIKVLQFGEGNFLRGFVDWMIDVMNEKTDFNGNVQVIQPIKNGMVDKLNEQQGLYHVVLNGIQDGKASNQTRLITSVMGGINPYTEFADFLNTAINPDLKFIISNTTEAGISFDHNDKDALSLPESFPGKLALLLYHRFNHFKGSADSGLYIIPCELIEKNGEMLQWVILQYISAWNLPIEFKEWVLNHNEFCNTLVDRIVPGFPRETIDKIHQQTGYEDNLVVMAEPFHLWVIEGSEKVRSAFPAEKAHLEVKFVKDLTPYRTRKVRILNGAHTALVPVAYLYGQRTVRESVDDAQVGNFIKEVIFDEIIPTLDLPKAELEKFAQDVIERFQNPYIKHELITIALNSIAKFKTRVLPSILEFKNRKGQLPKHLLYSLATLIRFYKGDWQDDKIALNDSEEVLSFFAEVWATNDPHQIVRKTLSNTHFWGENLNEVEGMTLQVTRHLQQIILNEHHQFSLS